MRKDVKFGLTIGAILAATLVVYVLVLTRGGDKNQNSQEVKLVTDPEAHPASGGVTAVASVPPGHEAATHDMLAHHDATPPSAADNRADLRAALDNFGGPVSPATEPSAAAKTSDWDDVLTHGPAAMSAAVPPDPTVTPTAPFNPSHPEVSIEGHPLIDSPLAGSQVVLESHPAAPDSHPLIVSDPAPSTRPASVGQRTHKIVSGETLSIIAKAAYGNSKYWDKILGANPGLDPTHLKVGTVLVIPDIASLPPISSANDHGADLPMPADTTTAVAVPVDPATSYKVVSGDSLEKIAIKLYGKREMMDNIFQVNKALMGDNENRLKVGWILKLPEPPTDSRSASR